MEGGNDLDVYFARLKEVLADSDTGPYILWGSDYHICAIRLSEKSYWNFYRERLSGGDTDFFEQIARDNPRRFLGWREDGTLCGNLSTYVELIRKADTGGHLSGTPAPWLDQYL